MPPILSQDSLRNFLKTLQLVGQKVPKKCMKLFVCPLARVVACSPVLLFSCSLVRLQQGRRFVARRLAHYCKRWRITPALLMRTGARFSALVGTRAIGTVQ